jgi:putative ABC transport system permease protein
VAVINEETKQQYFNNESAAGKTIEFDGTNYRVIGVVKNVSKLRILVAADIYVPITTTKDDLKNKALMASGAGYAAKILARTPSDFPAVKEEFQKHLAMIEFPDGRFTEIKGNPDTYLELISRAMFRDYDHANTTGVLMVLVLLMVLFMLLPAINLVNINVSRIMERASEIGIRKSFGASSFTLVVQFIVENIILTLIGGLISFIFTIIVLNIINSSGFIPNVELGLNFRIFLVSLFIILFFGLFSGVYPAFKMSRLKPVDALKGGQL